jgi:hypothetical protein
MLLIGQQGGNSASLLEGFLGQAAAFSLAIEKAVQGQCLGAVFVMR